MRLTPWRSPSPTFLPETLDKDLPTPIIPIVESKVVTIEKKLNKLNMVYEEKELDPFVCEEEDESGEKTSEDSGDAEEKTEEKTDEEDADLSEE